MAASKALDSRDFYTVGWIAALPIERTSAVAMLDERHGKPLDFVQPENDANIYTWGRIGEHNAVIATLPAGVYGTTFATATAVAMLVSFPQVRIGLLVGIGAGIAKPYQGRDIRLGDVAVSQPAGNTGGVVQYDLLKAKAGDEKESRAFLNRPPTVLLTALATIQSEHELGISCISEYLKEMVKNYPRLGNKCVHQGFENDKLFDVNNSDREVERPIREATEPEVHYGIIASGNTLFKDAIHRDAVLDQVGHDCICFEMEAAGLMNTFPCVVIRGISDYADSRKDDRWQQYASATAAAYAKELLGYIPSQSLHKTERAIQLQEIVDSVNEIHSLVEKTEAAVTSLSSDKMFKDIKKWLSAPDPSENLNQATGKRYKETGRWLIDNDIFLEWKAGKRRQLWIHGIPGCGKTILCSTIIAHLLQDVKENHAVLYFFFNFNDVTKQTLDKLLRSILMQLYSANESCRRELAALFSSCENGEQQPSTELLSSTFQKMQSHASSVYLIMDALDESRPRNQLLSWIKQIMTRPSGLSLLVTSRKEGDIESDLGSWIGVENIVPIQQDAVDSDICAFVHGVLHAENGFRRWRSEPSVLEEIETQLMRKANGMFRLAACQLDVLEKCLDYRKLKKAMRELPDDLYETYSRILSEMNAEHKKDTARILQFLVYSERPLTIGEMVDAIAVELDGNPPFDPKFRMPVHEEISRVCSTLVSVERVIIDDVESTILQLAHFSVKEYLLSDKVEQTFKQHLNEFYARETIMRVCLAYIPDIENLRRISTIDFLLVEYAIMCWLPHARFVESRAENRKIINNCFSRKSTAYHNWSNAVRRKPVAGGREAPLFSYACYGGLIHTVRWLLRSGVDVNARGSDIHTSALFSTCVSEQIPDNLKSEIAAELLAAGADVHMQDWRHTHALHQACIHGAAEVVRLLLAAGADVNAHSSPWGTPLHIAISKGNHIIVRQLLAYRASVGWQSCSLAAAARVGNVETMCLLLEYGADPNEERQEPPGAERSRSWVDLNPLIEAIRRGNEKMVEVLLSYGADVNSYDLEFSHNFNYQSFKKYALQIAVECKHAVILKRLIRSGACKEAHERALKRAQELGMADMEIIIARGLENFQRQPVVDGRGSRPPVIESNLTMLPVLESRPRAREQQQRQQRWHW